MKKKTKSKQIIAKQVPVTKKNRSSNADVEHKIGNVMGPPGPKGDSYVLTEQDKQDIAERVEEESLVKLFDVNIDLYDASKSSPPSTIVYIPGTVTLKDNVGNVIDSYNTNSKRLTLRLCQNTRYILSFSATGFETIADRQVVVKMASQDVLVGASPGTTTHYEVLWKNGSDILYSEMVAPHGTSTYVGSDPVQTDKIFYKWDKGVNGKLTDIIANTTVNAVFATPTVPATPSTGHDFIWSEDPADDSAYTLDEALGIFKLAPNPSIFVSIGDKIKFTDQLNSSWFDEALVFTVASFGHYKKTGTSEFSKISFFANLLCKQGHQMNPTGTNVGGYATSSMRTWLNDTFINILPRIIKGICVNVDVISSIGDAIHDWSTSSNKIYLASYSEVGFGTGAPYGNEIDAGANEKQFSIFTDNNSRIRKRWQRPDTANTWWLRSPVSSSSSAFASVNYYGTYNGNGAGTSYGVVVGFSC